MQIDGDRGCEVDRWRIASSVSWQSTAGKFDPHLIWPILNADRHRRRYPAWISIRSKMKDLASVPIHGMTPINSRVKYRQI
jgi:hypothetical protein